MDITTLKQNLQKPLPGKSAQQRMAVNGGRLNFDIKPDTKVAAVMALIYHVEDIPHIAYIQRVSTNSKDKHSGQISFPGGMSESQDQTTLETALRETHEEIGVLPSKIEVLGKLTDLYIPVSNFHVFPYVGFSSEQPTFDLQLTEVVHIIECPISTLTNPENIKHKDIHIRPGLSLKNIPYFDIDGKVLWGATAMMTAELIEIWLND